MTKREFIAGDNKFILENESDKIFTLKCYVGKELISEKPYAKEAYALSALRNKNNGELPEEVTGQTSDLIEVDANDIVVRKPKLEDVLTREDYDQKLVLTDWALSYDKQRLFSLPGYPDVKYTRENQGYFLLKKEKVEKKYRVTVVQDYNHFVREFLYPEVDFDLCFEDLFDKEHVYALKNKVNNIGSSYLDLAFYLYRFRQLKAGDFSSDPRFMYEREFLDIYTFAEKHLGFCKTTTKNMIAIVEKFADKEALKLQSSFEDYSYSQLTELCSVEEDKLDEFTSDMTIKEMREKKKELKAPSSKEGKKEEEALCKFSMYRSFFKNKEPWRRKFQEQEITEANFYDKLLEYLERDFVGVKFYLNGGYGEYKLSLFDIVTGCLSYFKTIGRYSLEGDDSGIYCFGNIDSIAKGLIKNGYVNDPRKVVKENEED